MKKIILILLTFMIISSCKDDNNDDLIAIAPKTGSLEINFSNTIDNTPIVLNSSTYINQSNETYSISELKYIISNIVLIKSNGEEFIYPVADSYFLINEALVASKKLSLNTITISEYSKIRFGIGVDQSNYPLNGVANFIPTAEENGMLWSWSAGYKFVKFEGSYTPQGGTIADFILHIGSHGTTLDNYKEVTLELPSSITISENLTSNLSIRADIAKIFDSTFTHSLQIKSDVQVDPIHAPKLAENVSTMFSVTINPN